MTVYRRPDPIPLPTRQQGVARGVLPVRADRQDLHAVAAREIFLAIVGGDVGPVLPTEQELGDQLGVSRTVVREAIKGLASKSIVVTRRSRGTIVLDRSKWNLLDAEVIGWLTRTRQRHRIAPDLWEIVSMIQPGLAALAAGRPSEKIAEIGASLAERLPDAELSPLLRDFHLAIAQSSENWFLVSVIEKCLEGILLDEPSFLAQRYRSSGEAAYRKIVRTIEAREAGSAERAVAGLFLRAQPVLAGAHR